MPDFHVFTAYSSFSFLTGTELSFNTFVDRTENSLPCYFLILNWSCWFVITLESLG